MRLPELPSSALAFGVEPNVANAGLKMSVAPLPRVVELQLPALRAHVVRLVLRAYLLLLSAPQLSPSTFGATAAADLTMSVIDALHAAQVSAGV